MTVAYDLHDADRLSDNFKLARKQAVDEYEAAIEKAADAKLAFRKAKAVAWVTAAAEGGTDAAKKIRADELAADAEYAMNLADGQVKVAKERIDAVEADRALFNKRLDMSIRGGG